MSSAVAHFARIQENASQIFAQTVSRSVPRAASSRPPSSIPSVRLQLNVRVALVTVRCELLPQQTLTKASPGGRKHICSDQCVYGSQGSIRQIWRDTGALLCLL